MFGDYSDSKKFLWVQDTFDVKQPVILVRRFCVDYQRQNVSYSKSSNNCRTFMMALCKYTGVPFDASWPCEDMWYRGRAWTDKTKNEEATDETECVVM